ncbi:hypothetical protein IAR55_007096 [Kwoniella newhampshirensis]|uniref:Ankyrin repeat-containing protein n=1 Tax=Kwoniella newhampshirensis TaxID=1651941 RepID=A0AAW0YDM4_9TREE
MGDEVTATQEEFESASKWLPGNPAAAGLSTAVQLELYGLYKFLTTSDGPPKSRPSIFYPTLRAKHDSFLAVHSKYSAVSDQEDARGRACGRYVQIARGVGWTGEIEEEVDLERLDDDSESEDENEQRGEIDESDKGKGKGTGAAKQGEGAWRSVSVMAAQGDLEGGDDGDEETLSPIHEAVISNSADDVTRLLTDDKTLINARDEFGYTPLHLAADRGFPELTKLLLQHGADSEAKDEDGQTPLMLAEISGREDIIALLKIS